MSGKRSKELRKTALQFGFSYRHLKRAWSRIPRRDWFRNPDTTISPRAGSKRGLFLPGEVKARR
jgi:hypothetical protein